MLAEQLWQEFCSVLEGHFWQNGCKKMARRQARSHFVGGSTRHTRRSVGCHRKLKWASAFLLTTFLYAVLCARRHFHVSNCG